MLYLMLERGMGVTKDKEKKKTHQRNTGGTGRDEEMWMVQAKRVMEGE